MGTVLTSDRSTVYMSLCFWITLTIRPAYVAVAYFPSPVFICLFLHRGFHLNRPNCPLFQTSITSPFIRLSTRPSVNQSTNQSNHYDIHASIFPPSNHSLIAPYPAIHPSSHPSIHPSICAGE